MQNFLTANEISIAIASGSRAAGTSDINGASVDMHGFLNVTAIVEFGTIAATAVTSVKMQQSSATASGWADISGSSVTVADDDDNQIVMIEVFRPTERYVRVVVDRGTANATIASAIYVQSNARALPRTNSGSHVVGAKVVTG